MDLRVTVVSPHRDDAALSAAATLDLLARRGAAVTLVSCYTRSVWAPCLEGATVEEVTRIRKEEDERYVRGLGGRSLGLSLDDAPLRRPGRPVFDPGEAEDAADAGPLAEALGPHLDADAVLVPLALGGHADHRVVRAAILAVARHLPLAVYEDIPYAFRLDPRRIAGEAAALATILGRRLYPVRGLHPSPFTVWRRAVRCYPSQFSRRNVALMMAALAARGGERLWVTHRLRRAFREVAA